jgi:hypothetical protein
VDRFLLTVYPPIIGRHPPEGSLDVQPVQEFGDGRDHSLGFLSIRMRQLSFTMDLSRPKSVLPDYAEFQRQKEDAIRNLKDVAPLRQTNHCRG